MLKKYILVSILIISYLISCILIYNNYSKKYKINMNSDIKISNVIDNEYLGYIDIPKINLKKNLFKINSKKNNIEYNVEVLKESIFPNESNSIIFLAAHSGDGDNAYFNDLKLLNEGDVIYISYNATIYKYIITNKSEVSKNGYITGNRTNNDEIVLTTCSDSFGKQLIINGILKK